MPRGGKQFSWLPEQDDAVRRLRAEGHSWAGIYDMTGISPKTLVRRADVLKLPRNLLPTPPLSVEQRQRVFQLRREDMSHRQIAQAVGCTLYQARKWGRNP